MSNDYYNHGSVPINRSLAQSALIRTEFDNVMAGFAKLPALTGNGYKQVIVNSAGTGLSVTGWKVYGGFDDTASVAVGTSALALATTGGIQNTAIGAYAMSAGAVSSFNNVAIGYQSLYSATTAQSNTAVGALALKANTTGNGNTAIGNGVMYQSVSGNSNTAVGGGSMNDRTSGDNNVAVGSASLYANATGANNTAIGYLAARYFTGSNITAIGYQACYATVTGERNTAVGYEALLADTGYGYNTAIGFNALKANTSGGANTAVGSQALDSNTTGSLNVSIGQSSMANNETGDGNTAVGNSALANNISGNDNVAIGSAAGNAINSGTGNTMLGADANVTAGTENNSTAIGNGATATASNQVMLGNASVTQVATEGRMAIGAAAVLAYETAFGAAGAKSIFSVSDTAGEASQALAEFSNGTGATSINFIKGRGTAAAATIVQNGDNLGGCYFYGVGSASALGLGASIIAFVDGTPGAANDMPSSISVKASADGSATPQTIATFKGPTRLLSLVGGLAISGRMALSGASYTVSDSDTCLIVNNAGTVTLTLPSAATYIGRLIMLKTVTANAVISASANVVPLAGGAATTAILAATAGKWATLIANGTNWEILASN